MPLNSHSVISFVACQLFCKLVFYKLTNERRMAELNNGDNNPEANNALIGLRAEIRKLEQKS
jgi:hypothetical protein